jgi:hypothetical protein
MAAGVTKVADRVVRGDWPVRRSRPWSRVAAGVAATAQAYFSGVNASAVPFVQ